MFSAIIMLALGEVIAIAAVPIPEDTATMRGLEGTTWGMGSIVLVFQRDGGLLCRYQKETYPGSWKQDGEQLYFEVNQGFFKYRGTIGSDAITGQGSNDVGHKFNYRFSRRGPP